MKQIAQMCRFHALPVRVHGQEEELQDFYWADKPDCFRHTNILRLFLFKIVTGRYKSPQVPFE